MTERKRFIDVNKMSPEEVDVLSAQVGLKIKEICDGAVAKANELLNIYGAHAKMMIQIAELPAPLEKAMAPKKKRGRPRKAPNLKQESQS